jgi:selenocysteine-specific elongation factor
MRCSTSISPQPRGALWDRVSALLEQQQRDAPWVLGLTLLGLSKRLRVPEDALTGSLAGFVESGRLAHKSGYYTLPGFMPELTEPQRAFFDAAASLDSQSAYHPISVDSIATEMKFARVAGLHHAFEALLAIGVLIQVGRDLYRAEQIQAIRGLLEAALRHGNGITPAQFRDLIGTSRKHALPLLEWFDAENITMRSGDVRTLQRAPAENENGFRRVPAA